MDEVNVKQNNIALSVFRSACGCLSDAPVSIVASTRAQVWCVSPMESIPATLCIFECAAATWFAGWACSADSTTLDHYSRLARNLDDQTFSVTTADENAQQVFMEQERTSNNINKPSNHLELEEIDKVSSLIAHVPICWIRSSFHTSPPNSAERNRNNTRVDSAIYTVGSSKRNAASMVPRIVVGGSVSTQFATCLNNMVAEHGGRCGVLPDASVFESLTSLRSEIISRSVQMPFFTVSPEAGIDRMTAQLPVLAETLALFEGSLYKPCVVTFHSTAIWTTADQPSAMDSFTTSLDTQVITATHQSIYLLSLPLHLPSSTDEFGGRSQLGASSATALQNFCGGARLRLFDLDTISMIDDGRSVLLVSRNGCCTTNSTLEHHQREQQQSQPTGRRNTSTSVLSSPSVVLRILFPTNHIRGQFVDSILQQCDSIKHPVIVCGDPNSSDTSIATTRVPKTILDLSHSLMKASTHEILDIGSAVAVADTDYCTSIECSTRPMWPVTFPVFADGFELTEFWKLLSLHTASLLVKFSRIMPINAHSSLALRISSCVNEIVGERWGRAYLLQRAATVLANCALNPEQRRGDATLSLQVIRFLISDCCILIAQATKEAQYVVEAKESVVETLRDVEAVTAAKPANTIDKNVPSVKWDKIQEQILLVVIEGALALGSNHDLVLSIIGPFAEKSFAPDGLPLATRQASQGPLSDLSKMDVFMSTALNAFPSSLFCSTHPLPALWRLVRPFLLPLFRSFFTRDSFDSMFPSGSPDLMQQQKSTTNKREMATLTEDEECQTVDSPLWRLLREADRSNTTSTSQEIEAATAGQIYLNRLFGSVAGRSGATTTGNNKDTLSTMRPSPPIVEDWLQLASMVTPQKQSSSSVLTRQQQQQLIMMQHQQQQQQQSLAGSPVSLMNSEANNNNVSAFASLQRNAETNTNMNNNNNNNNFSLGGVNYTGATPLQTATPGSSTANATPIQPNLLQMTTKSSDQILERRDQRIGELEMKEQSLQATISALHEELASVRSEVTGLLSEKRSFRQALLRERCDHLIDKEVTERRLLMGQEEVDRCGLHNFLIDHAIQESVMLLGEAGYRTLVSGSHPNQNAGRGLQSTGKMMASAASPMAMRNSPSSSYSQQSQSRQQLSSPYQQQQAPNHQFRYAADPDDERVFTPGQKRRW